MAIQPNLFISTGHNDKPAAEYLNKLFLDATLKKVSDVHFLMQGDKCYVQFQDAVDLVDVDLLDSNFGRMLDDKIRSRCNLNAAERHLAHDARMKLIFDVGMIDVRVSILPSVGGQKTVCRILDQSNSAKDLNDIKMSSMIRMCIDDIINEPQGLFLVSGPTGSGKTTLLYGILNELNDGKCNIITIENPVEYTVDKITQVDVSHHLSFAQALRAALRQHPRVILVGEIRDAETAKIAVEAANTGHLVLATVHANNSALAITRLLELGIDPQSLAATLRCVTAQRLVKTCTDIKSCEMRPSTELESEWLSTHNIDQASILPHETDETKYEGKAPIIEMIRVDRKVRTAILSERGEVAVFDAAINQPQFETLAMAGMRLARSGITTFEQVAFVVGKEAINPTVVSDGQKMINEGKVTPEQLFSLLETQALMRQRGFVRTLEELLEEVNAAKANEHRERNLTVVHNEHQQEEVAA